MLGSPSQASENYVPALRLKDLTICGSDIDEGCDVARARGCGLSRDEYEGPCNTEGVIPPEQPYVSMKSEHSLGYWALAGSLHSGIHAIIQTVEAGSGV